MTPLLSLVAMAALVLVTVPAASAATPKHAPSGAAATYVVVLRDSPLAAYSGGIAGYDATTPTSGRRFDSSLRHVAAYRTYLQRQQAEVLQAAGDIVAMYSYTTTLNGFAAKLSAQQVKQLQSMPDVLLVERSEKQRVEGSPAGGDFDVPDDLGRRMGGPARAGRGVVIGVVDTGVWPENPSFAGVPSDAPALARRYPGFTGSCPDAERWSSDDCNAKIVAARYFVEGFGADNIAGSEYLSPRDGDSHGSHTASIAAGNAGVAVQVDNQHFGHVSGTAPGAAIAIYKACWKAPDPRGDGCTTADTVKAVDQAVSDGVDVLNYSIGGSDSVDDAIELAFLNASAAGVFVATAAGDGGPGDGSVMHASPWVTTVAASGKGSYQGAIVLGDGSRVEGAMVSNQRVTDRRLIAASDAPAAGMSSTSAALCLPASLDAGRVGGAIVVCDRGVSGRVDKSLVVSQAGGVAMILANTSSGGTDADLHSVPTVHIDVSDRRKIERYLATHSRADGDTGRASLVPGGDDTVGPRTITDFSGRGPSSATGGDVLKPDIAADGTSVLAAVSPPADFGRLWDLDSGTSMAAPAVAGFAARVRAHYPSWSAAAVKSALVTTAVALPVPGGPLTQGAGVVNPRRFTDPGLVYDVGLSDWQGFLRTRDIVWSTTNPPPGTQATRLNLPAISLGSMVGDARVTRSVTNVSDRTETYLARVSGVRGVEVSVVPDAFTLAAGESADFAVAFSATKRAKYGRFVAGSLTWRGSHGHRVTSPIVVRPEYLNAPPEVAGVVTDGSVDVAAKSGVTGTIRTSLTGLVGAAPIDMWLAPGGFDPAAPASSPSTEVKSYTVASSSELARFEVTGGEPDDDFDLYVYRDGQSVAAATSPAPEEQLTLLRPQAGRYDVYVVAARSRSTLPVHARLTGWALSGADRDNAQVDPSSVDVTGGRRVDLSVSWRHLDPAMRWFGYVAYADSPRRTYVTID